MFYMTYVSRLSTVYIQTCYNLWTTFQILTHHLQNIYFITKLIPLNYFTIKNILVIDQSQPSRYKYLKRVISIELCRQSRVCLVIARVDIITLQVDRYSKTKGKFAPHVLSELPRWKQFHQLHPRQTHGIENIKLNHSTKGRHNGLARKVLDI